MYLNLRSEQNDARLIAYVMLNAEQQTFKTVAPATGSPRNKLTGVATQGRGHGPTFSTWGHWHCWFPIQAIFAIMH